MMSTHQLHESLEALLDRPIWASLTTRHRRHSKGVGRARRFDETIGPFAATNDDTDASLEAMTLLVENGRNGISLLQATEIVAPPKLNRTRTGRGVQMLASKTIDCPSTSDAKRLYERDASDMVALARLTEPGPFEARTHILGDFWGVRRDGQLVAMAGERLKLPGHTEISGVCVRPEHRGQGLAELLVRIIAARIQGRGETPYLHAFAENEPAIRLYHKLGFHVRTNIDIGTFERRSSDATSVSFG